jgi:hypothetical protein
MKVVLEGVGDVVVVGQYLGILRGWLSTGRAWTPERIEHEL